MYKEYIYIYINYLENCLLNKRFIIKNTLELLLLKHIVKNNPYFDLIFFQGGELKFPVLLDIKIGINAPIERKKLRAILYSFSPLTSAEKLYEISYIIKILKKNE